jgi:hypothetical protein
MVEAFPLSSCLTLLTVLAVVVGGSYLYRTQRSSDAANRSQQLQQESTLKNQESPSAVLKESEFPDNWWTGKDIFELEKRAIFSKVSIPNLTKLQSYHAKCRYRHGSTSATGAAFPNQETITLSSWLVFHSF